MITAGKQYVYACFLMTVMMQSVLLSDAAFSSNLPPSQRTFRLPTLSLLQQSASEDDATFESLGLSREVLSSIRVQPDWHVPTHVQRLAIPRLLDESISSAWCEAPTGSGKTASYALPLLELLKNQKSYDTGRIASMVLCPTRELAAQIGSVFESLTKGLARRWNIVVIHGGVSLEPQIIQLANAARDGKTVDVLIATPGRLFDVLTHYDNDEDETTIAAAVERRLLDALDQRSKRDSSLSLTQLEELKLDSLTDDGRSAMKKLCEGLEYLVLDEADRLLGRAFESDLDNLLELLPSKPLHTWLFSATFPKQIEPRVDHVLKRVSGNDASPIRISCLASDRVAEVEISGQLQKRLERVSGPISTLEQIGPASSIQLRTIRLEQPYRTQALRRLLEENEDEWDRVLVFVATRYASQHVARKLRRVGIESTELHGKLDQETRLNRLSDFRKGKFRVLLATDVASRGLDVVGLPAVVNYDLPRSTADFCHRIGRTGRAGRRGTAVTFVTPVNESHLDLIEKRHLVESVQREVLPGLEPNEEEWNLKSEASRISAPGTVHSNLGLAHDRMHGGIKGRRKSKKDRLREKAAREAADVKQIES